MIIKSFKTVEEKDQFIVSLDKEELDCFVPGREVCPLIRKRTGKKDVTKDIRFLVSDKCLARVIKVGSGKNVHYFFYYNDVDDLY